MKTIYDKPTFLFELRTDRVSLRSRLQTWLVRMFAVSVAKKGKSMCDPDLFAGKAAEWKCPDGYTMTKISLENCGLEIIRKKTGNRNGHLIYYLHGGGYTMPLSNLYRDIAVMLSGMTGDSDVILLDYRIAPEHVYPAALDDALAGWNKIIELGYSPSEIMIAGESAGGNLTLALTALLRDRGMELPDSIAVMSPWADLAAGGESYIRNMKTDPLFGVNKYRTELDYSIAAPYAGNTPLDDPGLSPVYGSFENFPPMFIQVATGEMLYSDTITISMKANDAGVDVTAMAYTGLFHCFQYFAQKLPESILAWNDLTDFINRRFSRK